MILSNSAILAYLNVRVQQENSHLIIDVLGQTIYSITALANFGNWIQICMIDYKSYVPSLLESFSEEYTNLYNTRNSYVNYNSNWTSCSCTQELFDLSTHTTIIKNSTFSKTILSMNDFLSNFIEIVRAIQGKTFMDKVNASNFDIKDEVEFMEF